LKNKNNFLPRLYAYIQGLYPLCKYTGLVLWCPSWEKFSKEDIEKIIKTFKDYCDSEEREKNDA